MVVYRRGNRRSVLILLFVTSITLITLDVRGSGPITGARGVAHDVVAPIATVADKVFSPVGDWVGGVTRAGTLKDENSRLRKELDELRGKAAQNRAFESENEELSKLLDLPYTEDSDAIAARVVSGSPGNFEWTVQIDRGTSDGVAEGMAVVTGAGLVGRIVEASGDRATALLLRDPKSGVAVVTESARTTGVAQGRTGESTLRLDFVDPTANVDEGELVFTSGRDNSRFPPSIPVARVEKVAKKRGELQQDIVLAPLVDLDSLEFVKVLRSPTAAPTEPATGEDAPTP
ncbi:MAG: rod shape-determining protein MreC [Actinobacteria bacterium]|nr:rod shape-determining protein MreC [Actinomycetota bacterium]